MKKVVTLKKPNIALAINNLSVGEFGGEDDGAYH